MLILTGTILDDEAPRARVAVLLNHFSELGDDRDPWRVMYPLKEVMLLVVCATIAGCDDFDDICAWGRHHLDFLRGFSQFHHGIPCERWMRKLVNRVDPILFGRCFTSWVAALWPDRHDLIAIDGKTARRTHDRRNGLKALHTLSACDLGTTDLRQLSVPEKTNEITAIRISSMNLPRNCATRRCAGDHRCHGLSGRHRRQDRCPQGRLRARPQGQPADPGSRHRILRHRAGHRTQDEKPLSRRAMAASRPAPIRPPAMSIGSCPTGVIRASPGSPPSRPSSRSIPVPNSTTDALSTPATSFHPRPSTSSGWLAPFVGFGGWKAGRGCSMSSSAMTFRAAVPDRARQPWPAFAGSPSALVRANKRKGSVKTRRESASWDPKFLLEILQLK